jgi:hypothetical protein
LFLCVQCDEDSDDLALAIGEEDPHAPPEVTADDCDR